MHHNAAIAFFNNAVGIQIFNQSANAMLFVAANGNIIRANPVAQKLMGYSNHALCEGQSFIKKILLDSYQKDKLFNTNTLTHDASQPFIIQTHLLHTSGKMVPIELRSICISDNDSDDFFYYIEIVDTEEKELLQSFLYQTNTLAHTGGFAYDVVENKVYWSTSLQQIHEITIDDHAALTAEYAFSFVHANSKNVVVNAFANAVENGASFDVEAVLNTALGKEKLIKINGHAELLDGACYRIVGAVQDITEQKQKELEFEQQQQLHQSLFYQNPDAIVAVNNCGDIAEWNPAFTNLLQADETCFFEKKLQNFVSPSDIQAVENAIQMAFNGSNSVTEVSLLTKTAHTIHLALSVIPIYGKQLVQYAYVIFKNITENKVQQQQLWNERQLLRTLVDNLPISVFAKDKYGRKILTNPSDLKLMRAHNAAAVIGKTDLEIYDWSAVHIGHQQDERVLKKGEIIIEEEEVIPLPTGYNAYVKTNKIPLYDAEGNINGLVGFSRDVTASKSYEDQLKIVDFAFRQASIGIFLINQDASFFDFNEKAAEIFGYTKEEMKLLKVGDFSEEFDEGRWQEHWHELQQKKSLRFTTKEKRKDGTWIDVEIQANLIRFGNRELNCAFLNDITQRLQQQQALELSIERFHYAMLATSDALWEIDLVRNQLYLNESFSKLFGHKIPQNEVFSMHDNVWSRNVHPDDLPKVLDTTHQALNTNNVNKQYEYRFRKANGQFATVRDRLFIVRNDDGQPIKLVGSMEDITNETALKNQLNHTLYELNQQKFALDQHSIVAITDVQGNIEYVNDKFCNQTGYERTELLGKNLRILRSGTHSKEFWKQMFATINAGNVWHGEICNAQKDGQLFWLSTSIVPFIDPNTGLPVRYIAISTNITQRIKAETEKELLVKELTNSNAELKQFGYITTHNLRSPLTNLQAICELINMDDLNSDNNKLLIEGFKTSTYSLKQTLDDLLEILIIKQNPRPDTEEIVFEAIFDKVKNSLSHELAASKATVQTNFAKVPDVIFNPVYLESIFLNLLTNALKYAQPNIAPVILVESRLNVLGKVELVFADNGLGMDMEKIKGRIFGLYQRFHRNANSKGIGLYLVHAQLQALGGSIEVVSKINEGTTFIITFS